MNGYELSRRFFDFSFENYQCGVYHIALFMWIIELNNRLGWKKQFGLPTRDTMEGLGIGNKNTYYSTIKDLVSWGFIKIIQESKNQYQSTIIEICYIKSEPALMTALDTALIQHGYQQGTGIDTSSVPIDKQVNKETNKPRTRKPKDIPEAKEVENTKLSEEWITLLEGEETFTAIMAKALIDIGWKPKETVAEFTLWVKGKMEANKIEACEKDFYKLKSGLSGFVDHFKGQKVKNHKSTLGANFCLHFNLK